MVEINGATELLVNIKNDEGKEKSSDHGRATVSTKICNLIKAF